LLEEAQTDAAAASIREAVAIARDVLRSQPEDEDARWQLAVTLSNLSRILARLDDQFAALQAAEEYEALTRELARGNPSRFENALALSLTALASRLSTAHRFVDALATVTEAIMLYRQRQASERYFYAGGLADALNELSIVLLGLRRRIEALSLSEEAVGYQKELEARVGTHKSQLEQAIRQADRVRQALDSADESLA
jgi:hypothetical protein